MMAIKNATKSLLLISLLASCSKIQVTTPASRFITPEAQGKLLNGTFRVEQQGGTEGTVDFSGDRTDNPLELRNNVTPIATSVDLGLVEKLDLVVKGNANSTSVFMLKYQLMGDSRANAQAGNQSLAIGVGYGNSESQDFEADSGIFDNSNDEVTASISEQLLDLSLIYGYRPQNDTLVYANVSAMKQTLGIELEQDDNGILDGEDFELQTWAYGLALGAVRYWEQYYFMLELSAHSTNFDNNDPTAFGFFTMSLGYQWN